MTGEHSIMRRLLQDISYDGKAIKRYRKGGLGIENVLTAEVLQGLDFLPREYFFKAFVKHLNGSIDTARDKLVEQSEKAAFHFLPGPFYFQPGLKADHTKTVNPDGIIETPDVYVFVEAKRIRGGSFQSEQLAREFVVAVREAKDRVPLLLLILGKQPPVRIKGAGKQDIEAAIISTLKPVLAKVAPSRSLAKLSGMVHESVAWITWQSISEVLSAQLAICARDMGADDSVYRAIARVAGSVIGAIKDQK